MKEEEEQQQQQQTIMSCTFIDSDRKGEEQINADTATTATSNGTDNDAVPAVSATTTTTQPPLNKTKKKKKKKAGYKNMMADILSGNAKNVSTTTNETDHRMDGLGGGNFSKVDKI